MTASIFFPKTGTTTSYYTGDDGDLERGIARSYTVLDTGQYSGTTNITVSGQTESKSNNCVLDDITGLMWTRYQSQAPMGPGPGKGYPDGNGSMPWATDGDGNGIWPYLAAANAASLAGHNDWRIPNIFELLSLHLFGDSGPFTFDTTAFDGSYLTIFSSTTWDGVGAYLSTLGYDSIGYVMLVRGNPSPPAAGGNSLIHGMVDS